MESWKYNIFFFLLGFLFFFPVLFAFLIYYIQKEKGGISNLKKRYKNAFVAAVIGGIGSLPGAVIGGLLIGLISEFAAVYGISSWTVTIVYGIFVIILLFKPAGLLGKDIREKV